LIALIFIMSQKGKNVPTKAAVGTETLDEDDYDDGF